MAEPADFVHVFDVKADFQRYAHGQPDDPCAKTMLPVLQQTAFLKVGVHRHSTFDKLVLEGLASLKSPECPIQMCSACCASSIHS